MSLDYNREANSNLGIALCHTHFGRLYENEGRWNEAYKEYMQAYTLMADGVDEWHWLEACIALSRLSIKTGDIAAARSYADMAKATAHKIQSLEHLAEVYNLYYMLNEKLGDGNKALENYILSRRYADSLQIEKTASHMQNVRVRYERETHQRELEMLQSRYDSDHRMHVTTLIAVSLIALLLLLLAVVFWHLSRTRAAKNRLMKQLEETRASFFTNITHEIRTPLTIILGMSESIAEGRLADDQLKSAANAITRQGHELLCLVNQLLDISRVKSQIGTPDWHRGNIVHYVEMLVESYLPAAQKKKVSLRFSTVYTNIDIPFAPDYIHKILGNLISNAIKYSDAGGNIFVELLHKDSSTITLRVSDEGIGMSAEDIQHIFEPYYIGNAKTTDARTGIGMSLVSLLVTALGGKIKLNTQPECGSVFTVTLPIQEGMENVPKWEIEGDESLRPVGLEEPEDSGDLDLDLEGSEDFEDSELSERIYPPTSYPHHRRPQRHRGLYRFAA